MSIKRLFIIFMCMIGLGVYWTNIYPNITEIFGVLAAQIFGAGGLLYTMYAVVSPERTEQTQPY